MRGCSPSGTRKISAANVFGLRQAKDFLCMCPNTHLGMSPIIPALNPIKCAASFDFEQLLRDSTEAEFLMLSVDDDDAHGQSPGRFFAEAATPFRPNKPTRLLERPTPYERLEKRITDRPQSRGHEKRRWLRQRKLEEEGYVPRRKALDEHVRSAMAICSPIDFSNFPSTNGAYSAKLSKVASPANEYSVTGLVADGFELIRWDGYCSRPIVDEKRRVVAVLVGQPKDSSYAKAADAAFQSIVKEGEAASFHPKESLHRRGAFPAINVGVTHGKGTQVPVYLNNHRHGPMMDRLLADADIQRLAVFASTSFATWAPKVYAYYRDHLNQLFEHAPHLPKIFDKSIYPAAAFNFGPRVWTYKHKDVLNCPFGWCAIQALGRFDPTKGGHLILWELKLVIEFPPGSLVLIPSATFTHSNIPVMQGDTRASFTQYCAGGLFRYVDYGFRREKQLMKEDKQLYLEICRLRPKKWEMGLSLLSTLEELK